MFFGCSCWKPQLQKQQQQNASNLNQEETNLVQFCLWTNLLLPSPRCSKPGAEETSVVQYTVLSLYSLLWVLDNMQVDVNSTPQQFHVIGQHDALLISPLWVPTCWFISNSVPQWTLPSMNSNAEQPDALAARWWVAMAGSVAEECRRPRSWGSGSQHPRAYQAIKLHTSSNNIVWTASCHCTIAALNSTLFAY